MKNIAVFVSGSGSNFQSLLDHIKDIQGEIKLVLSSKEGVYALERAKNAGIPAFVVTKDDGEREKKILRILDENRIDLIVLAGYMSILSSALVARYRNRIINIHPSLIPAFCGKGFFGIKVAEAMLSRGVKVAGATVHFVDEGADTGPIILQETVRVFEDDTPESLQKRVLTEVEHKLLPEAVKLFCADRLQVEGNRVKIIGDKQAK